MDFGEAERIHRELEDRLFAGDLTESDFSEQVSKLSVIDADGRRWKLSGRSGRWLVHDGQQWVFAEPPSHETIRPTSPEIGHETMDVLIAEESTLRPVPRRPQPPRRRVIFSAQSLLVATAVFVLLGCLIGGGIAAWVFLLRGGGEAEITPTTVPEVGLVVTYTPRPVTPTYTPTFTPTPSRTPTASITPTPTASPVPSSTPSPVATKTALPATPTSAPTIASPTSTPRPVVTATDTPAPVTSQTYTVQLGDTLSEIAAQFGITVQALAQANGISNQALIRPGQVLVIPAAGASPTPSAARPTATWTPLIVATRTPTPSAPSGQTYTVRPGDTLSGIAARFGVSVNALAEANGITNAALIRVGQVLVIPVPGTTPTTPEPTTPGLTPTPRPTQTSKPVATPTTRPATLSGKIAFAVWNPSLVKYELYVSRIDGTGRNRLGEGFRQPQFRPDGQMLAVNGEGAPNYEHLVIMDPSGGGWKEVSNHSEDSYPTWRADGALLAYSSESWGDGRARLGIVEDLYGRQQDNIPVGTREVEGEYPFWMSDGRIVYHGCNFLGDGGSCGLYWVNASGGAPLRLTDHESDTAPAGFGSRVAYMSARDGDWEVFVLSMNGGTPAKLTDNGAQDGLPTWSPDGKAIAFVTNRGGVWAIWVMDADGRNQRKLFDLPGGYGNGQFHWTTERISWAP